MDIFKLIVIGISVVIFSTVLKKYKSEHSVMLVIISAVIFFVYILNGIKEIFEYLMNICTTYGIDTVYFEILLKTLGISYVCEFASALCKDSGESAVAVKIDIAGKITIVLMTLPLFRNFVETLIKIMP